MNDQLRTRIARAAIAAAVDLKRDHDDTGTEILIDVDHLLDVIEPILDEHIAGEAGAHLELLRLTPRTHNALLRYGTRTIEQLTACTSNDLLAIRTFGQATLAEIQAALAVRGLSLADETAATPAAPADFFQAGKTYTNGAGNPTIFQVRDVAQIPGTGSRAGELVAFGFSTTAMQMGRWSFYVCRPEKWAEGWTEYDESAPAAEATP